MKKPITMHDATKTYGQAIPTHIHASIEYLEARRREQFRANTGSLLTLLVLVAVAGLFWVG